MKNVRTERNRGVSRSMLVTPREMLLAQLLLRVADSIAENDRDQEFINLYNECRSIAEGILR